MLDNTEKFHLLDKVLKLGEEMENGQSSVKFQTLSHQLLIERSEGDNAVKLYDRRNGIVFVKVAEISSDGEPVFLQTSDPDLTENCFDDIRSSLLIIQDS